MKLRYAAIILVMLLADCDLLSRANTPASLRIYSSSNMLGYLKPCG